MKQNQFLKFLSACLFALAITSCAPIKPIEFRSVNNFQVKQLLSSSPELSVDLNLHNPNSFGGTMKKLKVDLFLSDVNLASIQMQNVRVKANGDFSLPLTTATSYQQLITFLPTGISSFTSGKDIPFKLSGTVTMKKFLFSKTFPLEFHDSINSKNIKTN